jgi:hypothetical protein
VAGGFHVDSLAQWDVDLPTATALLEVDQGSRSAVEPVLLMPLVYSRPLRPTTYRLQTSLWPGQDLFDTWQDVVGAPLPTPLFDAVFDAHQALQGLSGLAVLAGRRDGTAAQQAYADQEVARVTRALEAINELQPGDDAVVATVANTIADLADRVQNEIDGHGDEASSLAAGVVSDQSDDHSTLVNLLGLSLHWDVDPAAAAELFG